MQATCTCNHGGSNNLTFRLHCPIHYTSMLPQNETQTTVYRKNCVIENNKQLAGMLRCTYLFSFLRACLTTPFHVEVSDMGKVEAMQCL